jgi:hypothetical protein
MTYATNEINGRDDRSAMDLRETLGERHHLRTVATAPGPDAVGHIASLARTFLIYMVLRQELLASEDEVAKEGCCLVRRKGMIPGGGTVGHSISIRLDLMVAPRLERDVVGRRAEEMLVAAADDEEVAVLYASIEADTTFIPGVGGEVFVEKIDEGRRLLRLEAPAGVVL